MMLLIHHRLFPACQGFKLAISMTILSLAFRHGTRSCLSMF